MITRLYSSLSVIALLVLSINSPLKAETIQLGTGDWCPFGCNPNTEGGRKGYLVDIIESVFNKKGYQIKPNYYPFNRNLKLTRMGKLDMIAGIYKEDAPDFIFPETHQGVVVDTFYTKNSNNWTYTDASSLTTAGSIALISGYAYGGADAAFKQYIDTNPNAISMIYGDEPLKTSISMLMKGRVSTFIEVKQVAKYNLMEMGHITQVRDAGHLEKMTPVYIAFSPQLPADKAGEYKQILTQGISELRRSGELAIILNNYGLSDWINEGSRESLPRPSLCILIK